MLYIILHMIPSTSSRTGGHTYYDFSNNKSGNQNKRESFSCLSSKMECSSAGIENHIRLKCYQKTSFGGYDKEYEVITCPCSPTVSALEMYCHIQGMIGVESGSISGCVYNSILIMASKHHPIKLERCQQFGRRLPCVLCFLHWCKIETKKMVLLSLFGGVILPSLANLICLVIWMDTQSLRCKGTSDCV